MLPEAPIPSPGRKKKVRRSAPVPDCHMPCPGSGVLHPQAFLRVFQGPTVRFYHCVIPECRFSGYMAGFGWDDRKVGMTRAEILAMNPNALIL